MKKALALFLGLVVLGLSGQAYAATTDSRFSDVVSSHENLDAINYVKDQGIVDGYPDGTFLPDKTINRAEFTKIIMEAVFPGESVGRLCFPDVGRREWFSKYVCFAKKQGIIDGYPDGYFKPAQLISFAEAAKIIVSAFDYRVDSDDIWYKPYVDELSNQGAIPVTIVAFDKNITRGEMAEMIYRLHGEVGDKDSLSYDTILHPPFDPLAAVDASFEEFDNIWNIYTDNTLGFSMQVPRVVTRPKCSKDTADVEIPTLVFHDGGAAYISTAYSYDWQSCEKIHHDGLDAIIKNNVDRWEIRAGAVNNDDELNQAVKDIFGDSCRSSSKNPASQMGAFDVEIGSNYLDQSCYDNSDAYALKYHPTKKKIIYWFLEEGSTWNKGVTEYDEAMIDSFKFE